MIAVVVTGLLALFVSGEDWGAKAQIQAVQAKNELAVKQAERSGATKIGASMAVRQPASNGFGDTAGPGAVGDTGGGPSGTIAGSGASAPPPIRPPYLPAVAPKPGSTYTAPGRSTDHLPGVKSKPQDRVQKGVVDANQSRIIRAASRQRSGSPEQGD